MQIWEMLLSNAGVLAAATPKSYTPEASAVRQSYIRCAPCLQHSDRFQKVLVLDAGVIAAAALKCMGGSLQGRLWPRSDEERRKAEAAGLDISAILYQDDLCKGEQVRVDNVMAGGLLVYKHVRLSLEVSACAQC